LIISALSVEERFNTWTILHGKSYKSQFEKAYRLTVYKNNLEYVENHNRQNLGFTLAMNLFADLTSEEFGQIYLGSIINATNRVQSSDVYVHNPLSELAATVIGELRE